MVKCQCGCGALLPEGRSYVHNHHRRGKSNTWKIHPDNEIDKSTAHRRGRKAKNRASCEWTYIGGCKGPIQVAHLDGDPWNNDVGNLRSLCQTHHSLLDSGRIDPGRPVMPKFRTGPDGKRRYKHEETT